MYPAQFPQHCSIVGVVIGTYSSIYVASTAIVMMGISKADLMPVRKEGEGEEGEQIEERPY